MEFLGLLPEGLRDGLVGTAFLQAEDGERLGRRPHLALRIRRVAVSAASTGRLAEKIEQVGPALPATPGTAVEFGFDILELLLDELDAPVQTLQLGNAGDFLKLSVNRLYHAQHFLQS